MSNNRADNSISITSITMEDNMFDSRPREVPRIRIQSSSFVKKEQHFADKITLPYVLVAVIAQIVLGILANSIALVADAARIFADNLEQHNYDRAATPGRRLTEIIMVGVITIIVFLLFIAFLLIASGRAATMDYDINIVYLIIGTILALISNTLQTMSHMRNWKKEPLDNIHRYKNHHRIQIIHGFGYHFVAYFLLISTFLIVVDKDYLLADVIATYIISLLILANVAAVGFRCSHEYFSLDHPQDEYEPLI